MPTARYLAARAGVAGALVGFLAILVGALLSPTFSLSASAVSDLGAPGAANPWILNAGLVASAAVSLPFAWPLWSSADHPVQRAGAVGFVASMAALALVGLFPAGTALHGPAAVAYFLLGTLTLWVHGTGTALAGAVRGGLATVWLGIVHVLSWLVWGAGIRLGPGLAVPELIGSVLLFAWLVGATLSLASVERDLPASLAAGN